MCNFLDNTAFLVIKHSNFKCKHKLFPKKSKHEMSTFIIIFAKQIIIDFSIKKMYTQFQR